MKYVLQVKKGLGGLNIHKDPDGKIIDAIEPSVWLQWVGTPEVPLGLTTWIEVTYSRPRGLQQRGWIAKHLVDFHRDRLFRENVTVHEHQEEYRKSVSFPKPPDIPRIELPECGPIIPAIPRGLWIVFGLAVLCVFGLLFKAFLHIP
jgi:hypothetical protein